MRVLLSAMAVLMSASQTAPVFPPIELHGHVYESDGRPAAYVLVSAIEPDRANSGSTDIPFTHTDRTGNFVLRLRAYGRYDITAEQAPHGFVIGTQAEAHATVDLRYGEAFPEMNLRLRGK